MPSLGGGGIFLDSCFSRNSWATAFWRSSSSGAISLKCLMINALRKAFARSDSLRNSGWRRIKTSRTCSCCSGVSSSTSVRCSTARSGPGGCLNDLNQRGLLLPMTIPTKHPAAKVRPSANRLLKRVRIRKTPHTRQGPTARIRRGRCRDRPRARRASTHRG